MAAAKFARENDIPFLGICYGFQIATIEFARNVCGMKGANTTEIEKNPPGEGYQGDLDEKVETIGWWMVMRCITV
jgi:anthranilate/para-aminobenzoate synthase component II